MTERGDRIVDPAMMHEVMRRRLTRRSVLKGAGTGIAGFSLASFLAACGGGDGGTGGDGGNGGLDVGQIYSGEPGDLVNFANWPAYMDQAKNNEGEVFHPTLRTFTQQTGIQVNYEDVINDNAEFFGRLQPLLAAGDDPGWDIIVITNGRYFTTLVANNWVYPLDPDRRPNFDTNAASWAKDPFYDPGNTHGMPWQSGITGIFYNGELVDGELTKMDDLANPDKVGTNSIGMLEGDMPDWVMINLGIDPTESGPEEWREAADWLRMQQESGTVRAYYGNDYLPEMQQGNLNAGMAWSGDVLYSNVWLGIDVHFVFPEGGALLWIDNMMVPAAAQNPVGAMEVMDFYYDPENATKLTEWVLYMSPVPETQRLIEQDAARAEEQGFKGYANKLYQTARSEFLYPSDEFISRTSFGRDLRTQEETEEWDSIFLPISQG
ncbi:MAG TPA: spermidine/putrescine ABC transporter substrate-binding protein [Actinomycetota bacterium]|jgi:spermidine/putrescine transport system substrate-binding protein|nr:spermidine/putrescine ABC transporter substrate-binding protein [Actinomycetota bacterium]